jgi:hypothetical protein
MVQRMLEYLTRHMIALKPLTYCGKEIKPGEQFTATNVDAEYFARHKRAAEPDTSDKPESAVCSEDQPATCADEPDVCQPEPEVGNNAGDQPQPRRRGRPRRNLA